MEKKYKQYTPNNQFQLIKKQLKVKALNKL